MAGLNAEAKQTKALPDSFYYWLQCCQILYVGLSIVVIVILNIRQTLGISARNPPLTGHTCPT